MTMHWNFLKSIKSRVAPWLRVLSDRCDLVFNSFPRLGDAFAVGRDVVQECQSSLSPPLTETPSPVRSKTVCAKPVP